jgi:hypothetical protein
MDKNIYMPEGSRGISIPNWLTRVSYADSFEEDFEDVFYTHAKNIFPDYHCLDFKLKVSSKAGATIPDFALIAKDYSSWIIGEVELASHNLTEHVLPQMERFILGKYDDGSIASKLCLKYPSLDQVKVQDLLRTQDPEVFLVANEFLDEWKLPLIKRGVKYISLEVYSSSHAERVIHVCGDSTSARLVKLAEGRPGPGIMGMKTVALDRPIEGIGETISIVVNGSLEEWSYVSVNNTSLLITTKSFKHSKDKYTIYKNPITGAILLN